MKICLIRLIGAIILVGASVGILAIILNSCSRDTIIVTSNNTPKKYLTNASNVYFCSNNMLLSTENHMSILGTDGKAITCKYSGEQ
mgnify:FL=1